MDASFRPFSFRDFCRELRIPAKEQERISEAMAQGLEDYYLDVYGYHKYGKRPDFLINERMGEPLIFGYGAVHILHREDISPETRQRVARYALSIVDQTDTEGYGTPRGLLLAIATLAEAEELQGEALSQALELLTYERDVFVGLRTGDIPSLVDALIGQPGWTAEEIVRWLRFLLMRAEYAFEPAKALLKTAMTHPDLPDEAKQGLCHQLLREKSPLRLSPFGLGREAFVRSMRANPLTPKFLMRHAIAWLPEVGADPQEVVRQYLGSGTQYTRDAINAGVADVIAAHHGEMPEELVREVLRQGVAHPAWAVRKAFYAIGLEILESDFIRPALEDPSKKVRRWAEKQLRN